MKPLCDLTAEFVRSILRYDEATGQLFWRDRADIPARINKRLAGTKAGCVAGPRGYIVIGIRGRVYLAHRLVWLIVTGEWPAGGLDHIDGNTLNNRFSNLRESDQTANNGNMRVPRHNRSGFKGVYRDRANGRWAAMIQYRGKKNFLGRFASAEEAARAYDRAAVEIYGEFAKTNFATAAMEVDRV